MYTCASLGMRFEGPASGIGCSISRSIGGCSLNRLVRHDSCCELLLGLLKTSPGRTVERVHLETDEGGK